MLYRYKVNLVGSKESTSRQGPEDEPVRALHQTQINLAWGSFEVSQKMSTFSTSCILKTFVIRKNKNFKLNFY